MATLEERRLRKAEDMPAYDLYLYRAETLRGSGATT